MMSTEGDSPAVRVRAASYEIERVPLLERISFEVARGERLAIIGPSGAGKTTLLRLIAGVLKPTQGDVVTLGFDTRALHGRRLRELRRQVGFLYQSDNLVPGLRVIHNVLMGRLGRWSLAKSLLSLLWPREIPRARAALDEVELAHKLWALPTALSGGEQQRVALARLLLQEPQLYLADEPVNALDVRLGREVIELLVKVTRARSDTLIVSLHALDLLRGNFQRVIALRRGQLVFDGAPEQLDNDRLRDIYGLEFQTLGLESASAAAHSGRDDRE
ncbi:MAG: phosphonate ABC transporter ATP-binding protein [Planctomycetota bacterium]